MVAKMNSVFDVLGGDAGSKLNVLLDDAKEV